MSDNKWAKPQYVKLVICINLCLLVAILILLGFFIYIVNNKTSANASDYFDSNFNIVEKSYDINPRRDYVVYTNYACPFCSLFYSKVQDIEYTTRLLILEKNDGRFATQEVVLPYMLKLSRKKSTQFAQMESYLFDNQDKWVGLDEAKVVAFLNSKTKLAWSIDDLQNELSELKIAKTEAPEDLEFVPSLYSEGKYFSEFVKRITEEEG